MTEQQEFDLTAYVGMAPYLWGLAIALLLMILVGVAVIGDSGVCALPRIEQE